jgi:hypothetical protein
MRPSVTLSILCVVVANVAIVANAAAVVKREIGTGDDLIKLIYFSLIRKGLGPYSQNFNFFVS